MFQIPETRLFMADTVVIAMFENARIAENHRCFYGDYVDIQGRFHKIQPRYPILSPFQFENIGGLQICKEVDLALKRMVEGRLLEWNARDFAFLISEVLSNYYKAMVKQNGFTPHESAQLLLAADEFIKPFKRVPYKKPRD